MTTARGFDRWFYPGMAVAVLTAVLVGFAPTYYLRSRFTSAPLPIFLHAHGLLFSAWIVMFLGQTLLVAARKTRLHRTLGWVGAGLAVLMIPVGAMAGILSMRAQVDAGHAGEAQTFLTTPLLSMLVFLILVGAAVSLRRRPEAHKRLMLLGTISLLDAPIARWPLEFLTTSAWALYAVADCFIVASMLYDVAVRRSVHPVYLWGGLLIVAGQALRVPIGQTEAWHAVARALLGG